MSPGISSVSGLLSGIAPIVTSVFGWVTSVASTIASNPLLLLTTGFVVIGGAIGVFGRLLSRN